MLFVALFQGMVSVNLSIKINYVVSFIFVYIIGNHLYKICKTMSPDEFRNYRILNIRRIEEILKRQLLPFEKEAILFPRLCDNTKCRESDFNKLKACSKCMQVAFCSQKDSHLSKEHLNWCAHYCILAEIIYFQEQFGNIDPTLPSKILTKEPDIFNNFHTIFKMLSCGKLKEKNKNVFLYI